MLSFGIFSAVGLIGMIPRLGPLVSEPFLKLMDHQKHTLHHNADLDSDSVRNCRDGFRIIVLGIGN